MGAYSSGMFTDGQLVDVVYVQATPYGSSSGNLAVSIKSAMPKISLPSSLKTKPQIIDSSCFANTNECKPSIAKKVETREWFWALAPNFPYAHSLISYGAALKARAIVNSEGLNFKLVSEELDPSWDPV